MSTNMPDITSLDELDRHLDRANVTLLINGEQVTLSKRGRFDYLLSHGLGEARSETMSLTLDDMLCQLCQMFTQMALKPYLGQRAYVPDHGYGTLVDLVEDGASTEKTPYARIELDGGVARWFPLTGVELMITHHAG